jgi:hypothetical protein
MFRLLRDNRQSVAEGQETIPGGFEAAATIKRRGDDVKQLLRNSGILWEKNSAADTRIHLAAIRGTMIKGIVNEATSCSDFQEE